MPLGFSAAYAFAFCAGLYFRGRLGWMLSVGLMLGTDLVLNRFFYNRTDFSWATFAAVEAPVLVAYGAIFALGRLIGPKRSWLTLLAGGLLGAILFYLITNTASWMTLPYSKTLAGWIQALTVGLPKYPQTWEFFRNNLLSGGLFTGLFVGAMKLTDEAEEAEEETEEEKEPAREAEAEPSEAKP